MELLGEMLVDFRNDHGEPAFANDPHRLASDGGRRSGARGGLSRLTLEDEPVDKSGSVRRLSKRKRRLVAADLSQRTSCGLANSSIVIREQSSQLRNCFTVIQLLKSTRREASDGRIVHGQRFPERGKIHLTPNHAQGPDGLRSHPRIGVGECGPQGPRASSLA